MMIAKLIRGVDVSPSFVKYTCEGEDMSLSEGFTVRMQRASYLLMIKKAIVMLQFLGE